MDNISTIPYRVESNVALALIAKLTQDDKNKAVELGKLLSALPTPVNELLSDRIMQYNVDTDLTKLASRENSGDRFRVYSAAEALKPQPPIDWIVEELFAQGTVSMIVGNPGTKKTYSMIDLGVCVAMGKEWLGFSTNQVPVLLIDEESGVQRINKRLGDAMRGHGADGTLPLHYISLSRFNLRSQGDGKSAASDLAVLEEKIQETKAKLVIIDALADIMPGGDENAVKDVQPVFMGLRQVADHTQSAIMVIHHANKSGDYRGSTAILGALDVMITVQSKQNSPNIDFEVTKHRDKELANFAAVANFDDASFSLTASQYVKESKLNAGQEYVLSYLIRNGDSLVSAIKDHADICSPTTANKAIYALAKMGLIARKDSGGSGVQAIYGLTGFGKEKMAMVM